MLQHPLFPTENGMHHILSFSNVKTKIVNSNSYINRNLENRFCILNAVEILQECGNNVFGNILQRNWEAHTRNSWNNHTLICEQMFNLQWNWISTNRWSFLPQNDIYFDNKSSNVTVCNMHNMWLGKLNKRIFGKHI